MNPGEDVVSFKISQLEKSLLKVDQAMEKQSEVLRELCDAVIRLGNIQSSMDRVEQVVNELGKSNADLQRDVDRLTIKGSEVDKVWVIVDKLKEDVSMANTVVSAVKWLATAIGGVAVVMILNHLF